MADYLGLDVSYADATEHGGSSYVSHVGHAKSAIQTGQCDVALVTLAGRPRSRAQDTGTGVRDITTIQESFERIYGAPIAGEANDPVQVDADVALAHGTGGGGIGDRHQGATVILGRVAE